MYNNAYIYQLKNTQEFFQIFKEFQVVKHNGNYNNNMGIAHTYV